MAEETKDSISKSTHYDQILDWKQFSGKQGIAFPKADITTGFEIGTGSGKCLAGSVTSNRKSSRLSVTDICNSL